jgi:hypothetical protein
MFDVIMTVMDLNKSNILLGILNSMHLNMCLKIETISTTLKKLWNYPMFNLNKFVHIMQGKGKTLVIYSE